MALALFYTTFPDLKVAQRVSRILVQEKLVACTNILSPCESHYMWNGKLCVDREIPVLLKTQKRLSKKLERRLLELHPYEIPTFLELSVSQKNQNYLVWMKDVLGS